MEIKVQSIHFDATEQLHSFIEKKVSKLEKVSEEIRKVEVSLKVVKPEMSLNKEVSVKLSATSAELFAEKVCDTFEEAIDLCVEALQKQLAKLKEKQRGH